MTPSLRVAVADDSDLLRAHLTDLLFEAGYTVFGSFASGRVLIDHLDTAVPDLALVDLRMPPSGTDEGLQTALTIRNGWPEVGVVVLTTDAQVGLVGRLMSRGPRGLGFLDKRRLVWPEFFLAAIARVAAGGTCLDPDLVTLLLARRRCDDAVRLLSVKERRLVAQLAEGVVPAERAEPQVTMAMAKLGLAPSVDHGRRVEAVLGYLLLNR